MVEVLVKWRELGYDLATWEELPAIQSQPGAQPALERLRSLRPIGQTVRLWLRRQPAGRFAKSMAPMQQASCVCASCAYAEK